MKQRRVNPFYEQRFEATKRKRKIVKISDSEWKLLFNYCVHRIIWLEIAFLG